MATITFFEEFVKDLGDGDHGDLNAATYKVALFTSSISPALAASQATPQYDDYTGECSATGNYATGGATIGSTGWSEAGGTGTLAAATASWPQHASNPTNARYGLIYNDTPTTPANPAIGYIDFGSDQDLSAGDFTITFTDSYIFTIA